MAASMRACVGDRLAEADVDDDLLDGRHLHRVEVAEFGDQRGHDLVDVATVHAGQLGGLDSHQTCALS